MVKIALIGAGSVVFSRSLTGDILSFPELRRATLSYMDIDGERLKVGAGLCRKVADALGAAPRIEATLDRRRALAGADFVIVMVQIGGFDATLADFQIPKKYGLRFTIADTTGPGGLFRALRTYPMLAGLCRDMEDLCPRAVLLNYSNPMGMNMQTVRCTSGLRAVGLCHSVQGTFHQLAGYLGEAPEDLTYLCAGLNHMAFFLRLEKDGQDLYPRLFKALRDPRVYNTDKVRFELMKRLGYFVTESSEHSSEYCPYFIPHGADVRRRYDVPLDEYLRRCETIVGEFAEQKALLKSRARLRVGRSQEYGSGIIHSQVTGTPRVVYGNMPNAGTLSNLPATAIVEAPTLVDRAGMRFARVGEIPPQLVGYLMPHIVQQELFIRAATEGRRDHVYQAAMFDPLTSASLTLDQIVDLCDELIAAHTRYLPKLDRRTLIPGSGKTFRPPDMKTMWAEWDAEQAQQGAEYLQDWHVIGAFASRTPGRISLAFATPVERDFRRHADGRVNLAASYPVGRRTLRWRPAHAGRRGFVDFDECLGRVEWAVGYAYRMVESARARKVLVRCGSDDGLKVWLNGAVVHEHEVGRGYSPDQESFTARLRKGANHIFVKVDNYQRGWGFGLCVPKEDGAAK